MTDELTPPALPGDAPAPTPAPAPVNTDLIERVERIREAVGHAFIGQGDVLDQILIALLAGGHSAANDDGEPGGTAGRPMLDVLRHQGLDGVLATAVRYWGGVKLGAGGLVRAYTDCIAQALLNDPESKALTGPVADIARLPLKLAISTELQDVYQHGVAQISRGEVEPG